jgi:hypothetical protein
MSATLYNAVDNLEVKGSMGRRIIGVMEETERLPMLLLNKTPDTSPNA